MLWKSSSKLVKLAVIVVVADILVICRNGSRRRIYVLEVLVEVVVVIEVIEVRFDVVKVVVVVIVTDIDEYIAIACTKR
jgi:hypothetical protein